MSGFSPESSPLVPAALVVLLLFLSGLTALYLRQSFLTAYLLLGLSLGPFFPDSSLLSLFGSLGMIFLMFFIGLGFPAGRILRSIHRLGLTGGVDLAMNAPLGLLCGWILGWDLPHSLLLAGIIYVSSSAIISKNLIDHRRAAYPETEAILGVLVFEDLVATVLLALLPAWIGRGIDVTGDLLPALAPGVAFVLIFFSVAWIGIRPLNRLLNLEPEELFSLLVIGLVVGVAALSEHFGLSAAVGSFGIGSILGEGIHRERIARIFVPFRDLFAAVFFFSFGASIDIWQAPAGALILILLVAVVGKAASGWLIGRIEGVSPRARSSIAVSLIARGEFSILLAHLAPGPAGKELQSLTGLSVLVLAVLGSVLMAVHDRVHARLRFWLTESEKVC